ncbi:DUF4450 domain-containing protein [Flavobacterium cellulosilyticum]|uniref:DUF4450 domain-containing protein n=1 Tax=Flavobacterium cellulosilyticum TaxID=2541731 RepID=A0A4R5C928_9FLAO|nr:DUF4450 domain-containing protein [Flavobacterium cellulosilyticum]TDD95705.1 DUF4450 domain-containing protein [Flavobacterium cellulosilyticum]
MVTKKIFLSIFIYLFFLFPILLISQEKESAPLRKIHYSPEGNSFVLKNGNRKFNRALYGTNTAFRVEAGDLPEFAMYMPGMGGNFKLGIQKGDKSKWITEAKTIVTRYTLGIMDYKISDPLLEKGELNIEIVALKNSEGFALKVTATKIPKNVSLIWAFGGASGKKFSRDGDIGADPESVFYMQPEYCINNKYTFFKEDFLLEYGSENNKQKTGNTKTLVGYFPNSETHLANANHQKTPLELFNSTPDSLTVISGKINSIPKTELFWMIENNTNTSPKSQKELAEIFENSVQETQLLANRVKVITPDPYINTLGSALSIAADGIWESPAYLHGAIAWRMYLNAWRGPYVADPLGWHDRAKTHFTSYSHSQLKSPLTGPIVPDETKNLARQKEKIGTSVFSSGYISRSPNDTTKAHHYDMNLVFIDQMLRHFKWTGDTTFIKEMFPVIQRHLAWEKRNFDTNNNGLYDAYAAIWASDALQYSGGAVTHSSAYNYYANKEVAAVAKILNEDTTPFLNEAKTISDGANAQLWIPKKGIFAEYKDAIGNQLVHDSPGIWSIYHTIDSELANPFQEYQMLHYVDAKIPHIPIAAEGLDKKDLYAISTTNWQPYDWSINNVALGEQLHTSLAFWQNGQSETAFKMWESALVDSMYLGASPGGFEQLSFYDAMRGELYRDFADPIGMTARTLVEGLFGIQPNALENTLTIRPGLPVKWDNAALEIPDVSFSFKRNNNTDSYQIKTHFTTKMALKLVVKIPFETIKSVTINGENSSWKTNSNAVGNPQLIIESPFKENYNIAVSWEGEKLEQPKIEKSYCIGESIHLETAKSKILEIYDPQAALSEISNSNSELKANLKTKENATFFVKLQQGNMIWWSPINLIVKPEIEVFNDQIKNNNLLFTIKNNSQKTIEGNLVFNPFGVTISQLVSLRKYSETTITVPLENFISGTNAFVLKTNEGKTVPISFTNWDILLPKETKLETVSLTENFNSKVTDIFNQEYLSPRPTSPTLQLPKQGIGNWCYPNLDVKIDDSGLRQNAKINNQISSPQGISFETPSDSSFKNIAFTSMWDNFPKSMSFPLNGKASHIYMMMAGTTNPMQSRFVNGEIVVHYSDGTSEVLQLKNPENWWPIEQDYFTNGLAFTTDAPKPPRVYLKSGIISRTFDDFKSIKGFSKYGVDGGAATILDLPLNKNKTLKNITLKTIANDVVIGLMSVTLVR